ncbi:AI-2E family transporter, partial [candidate division CSSED10-310 bacterium]
IKFRQIAVYLKIMLTERTKIEIIFFIFLFLISIIALLWLLRSFVSDFVFSFILVGLFYPLFDWLKHKLGNRKRLASGLVCFLIIIIVFGPVSFLVSSISVQAASIYQSSISTMNIETIQSFLFGDNLIARNLKRTAENFNLEYTPEKLQETVITVVKWMGKFLYDQVNALFSNILRFLYHFSVMILITFFLFVDGERFKEYLFHLSPLRTVEEERITQKFMEVSKGILLGNGISAMIQGVFAGFAFYLSGIPSSIFWGTVMSIMAFLPIIGISLIFIPASLFLFISQHYVSAIILFIFCIALSLFTENIVKTTLIGSKVKMHTLLVFLSILGGLSYFGILGILYGPLIVTFFITFAELYEQQYKIIVTLPVTKYEENSEDNKGENL